MVFIKVTTSDIFNLNLAIEISMGPISQFPHLKDKRIKIPQNLKTVNFKHAAPSLLQTPTVRMYIAQKLISFYTLYII